MNGKNRLVLFLVTVFIVIATIGVLSLASIRNEITSFNVERVANLKDETAYTSGNYEYTLDVETKATITKYNGTEDEVTIPQKLDDHLVIAIGDNAFANNTSLESVTIGNEVNNIGEEAFLGCTNLNTVVLEENVNVIGNKAFFGCNSLTTFSIPRYVETVGTDALSGCTSLSEIIVDSNNENYKSIDGVLYNKSQTELIKYPSQKEGTTFEIPLEVKTIASYAFESTSLENITVPKNVTNIEDNVFDNCNLTAITFLCVEGSDFDRYEVEGQTINKVYDNPPVITVVEDNGKYNTNLSSISVTDDNYMYVYVSTPDLPGEETVYLGNVVLDELTVEGNYRIYAIDNVGNETTVNFSIDKTEPSLSVSYDVVDPTNGNVIATITANEKIQNVSDWKLAEDFDVHDETLFVTLDKFLQMFPTDQYPSIYDNAQAFVDLQEDYKVNAVFGACITIAESNGGTKWDLIDPSTYNWVSIKGNKGGGYIDRFGTCWNKYSSYADALTGENGLGDLISKDDGHYYAQEKFLVSEIGAIYCNQEWAEKINDLMKNAYYGETEDWHLVKCYEENTVENVTVTDLAGNESTIEIRIENIDKEAPNLTVSYSETELTNENVVVTITSDKELQSLDGWTLSDDNKNLTKTYEENTVENVTVTDLAGNEETVEVKIENIDKTPLEVTILYSTTDLTNQDVIVTINANKEVQPIEGWELSEDGLSLTKTFSSNDTIEEEIKDYVGNSAIVHGAVDNIDRTVEVIYSITKAPDKVTYIEGQDFITDGMEITAKYNDDSSEIIEEYTIENGESLQLGQTEVIIRISEDETLSQPITVVQKSLDSIEIANPPKSTKYVKGQNFNSDGMIVIAIYDNGKTEEITNYTIIDGESLTVDKTSVTISYTENEVTKTVEQPITMVERVVRKLEITSEPLVTSYKIGDAFSRIGMVVEVVYNDGSKEVITNYSVKDGKFLKSSQTYVIISYTENGITVTAKQPISVSGVPITIDKDKNNGNNGNNESSNPVVETKTLKSIEITKEPTKLEYNVGENFDKEGMEVIAKYSDDTTSEITNYEIIDGNNLQPGTTSVTVSYTENEVTKMKEQPISVIKPNEGEDNPSEQKEDEEDKKELGYNIDDSMITNIKAKTPLEAFKTILLNGKNYNIEVKKENEEVTEGYIGTGMKIKLTDSEGNVYNYIAVVKGDVNGDGKADQKDSIIIKAHRAEVISLTGAEFDAADINNDKIVNAKDSRYLLYHRAEVKDFNLNY